MSTFLTNRAFSTLCVWKIASVRNLGSVLTTFTQVAAQLSPKSFGNTDYLKGHAFTAAPCFHFPFCPELKTLHFQTLTPAKPTCFFSSAIFSVTCLFFFFCSCVFPISFFLLSLNVNAQKKCFWACHPTHIFSFIPTVCFCSNPQSCDDGLKAEDYCEI